MASGKEKKRGFIYIVSGKRNADEFQCRPTVYTDPRLKLKLFERLAVHCLLSPHARYLPSGDHWTSVAPSGLLPSVLSTPSGSFLLGT